MKTIIKHLSLIFLLAIFAAGCSATGIQTTNNDTQPSENGETSNPMTTAESFANATTQQNVFSLGSDYPADIQIPDITGMRSTAFVVIFSPAAVVPIDLETHLVSTKFPVFDASTVPEAAFPNHVLILSPTEGILLGGGGLVVFNPSTGGVLDKLSLTTSINLTEVLPYSRPGDCDYSGTSESSVGPGSFSPSFAADLAVVSNRLFVTMSNACFDSSFDSFYPKSIVLVFDMHGSAPFFTPASTSYVSLSGFNATGITEVGDQLIVTSTGDTKFFNGGSVPETPSYLDELNPNTLQITRTLNLGLVAANFQPLAITEDGSKGFIGSSSFSEIYEIDLDNFILLRDRNNPIVLFDSGEDYISDQEIAFGDQILFASSFNNSAVKAVDLTSTRLDVLPNVLNFALEGNPGVTGAGPMALHPGQPNVDFTSPDLWVLTSSPGTVSSAKTY